AKARVAELRRRIYDPRRPGRFTTEYQAYLQAEMVYDQAQDALNAAQAEARLSGQPVPPGPRAAADAALTAWNRHGFKKDIDDAFAIMIDYLERMPAAYLQNLQDGLDLARMQQGHPDGLPVEATPPLAHWLDRDGWRPWIFSAADLAKEGSAA